MPKKLSEMTLEELWQLFPIRLTEHRAEWADWYEQEAKHVRALLPDGARVSHIGSTAVEGIWAKPSLISWRRCRKAIRWRPSGGS